MTSLNDSNEIGDYKESNALPLTTFSNRFAEHKDDVVTTWEGLVTLIKRVKEYPTKDALPYIKLATFGDTKANSPSGNSYRSDANLVSVSGIEGDYDAEIFPPEKAAQLLDSVGIKCLIYTSASHTPERPRFRLLAPLSKPYIDTQDNMRAYRRRQLAKIDNILSDGGLFFASESYTLSQGFTYGRVAGREYLTFEVVGDFVDRLPLPDNLPSPATDSKIDDDSVRFNLDSAMQALFDESNYHQSEIRIAAHYVALGVPEKAVLEMLQGIFKAMPNKGEKWQARYDYIPTAVSTAMQKFAPQLESKQPVFNEPKPLTIERLTVEPPAIPVLIPHIIPRDVFGLVGPGGVAKTTLALYMMVHIITGREIWGEKIVDPGACLFISAEDPIDTVRVRIYFICKELNLSESERAKVAQQLYIEDVTGKMVRFVEADMKGNLSLSQHVDGLISTYKDCNIKLVMADPAVFFGAGERYVNDNEATLMQAGRTISRGLDKAAVGFIHHMSKAGSQVKDSSAHAGRGGAAFGDNARSILVMHLSDGKTGGIKLPSSYDTFDISTKMYITVAKFSVGKKIDEPLWFLRHERAPFKFDAVRFAKDRQADKRDAIATVEDAHFEQFMIMQAALDKAAREGNRIYSKQALHNACREISPEKVGGVNGFGGLVDRAVGKGYIDHIDLPPEELRGQRKYHYIVPEKRAINVGMADSALVDNLSEEEPL